MYGMRIKMCDLLRSTAETPITLSLPLERENSWTKRLFLPIVRSSVYYPMFMRHSISCLVRDGDEVGMTYLSATLRLSSARKCPTYTKLNVPFRVSRSWLHLTQRKKLEKAVTVTAVTLADFLLDDDFVLYLWKQVVQLLNVVHVVSLALPVSRQLVNLASVASSLSSTFACKYHHFTILTI